MTTIDRPANLDCPGGQAGGLRRLTEAGDVDGLDDPDHAGLLADKDVFRRVRAAFAADDGLGPAGPGSPTSAARPNAAMGRACAPATRCGASGHDLQEVLGYLLATGHAFGVLGIGTVVGGVLGGRAVGRFGNRRAIVLGGTVQADRHPRPRLALGTAGPRLAAADDHLRRGRAATCW
ncbi:hypothetical protein SMICM17S_05383 [Streptomyces microflavus]